MHEYLPPLPVIAAFDLVQCNDVYYIQPYKTMVEKVYVCHNRHLSMTRQKSWD